MKYGKVEWGALKFMSWVFMIVMFVIMVIKIVHAQITTTVSVKENPCNACMLKCSDVCNNIK